VGGLESASWLTAAAHDRLRPAVDDLLAAADANGYTAVYGEDDALRAIENGLARGALLPLPEPVWYGERPFFQVGDRVRAVVGGQVKAVGRVARLRETRHWEYELDSMLNVWFARALLMPDRSDKSTTYATTCR
jgi:hypothetical protein